MRQGTRLTQSDFANLLRSRCGISISQVHAGRWLNGKRRIPARAMEPLARLLDISPAWLMFGAAGGLPDPRWYTTMLEDERAIHELGRLADEGEG